MRCQAIIDTPYATNKTRLCFHSATQRDGFCKKHSKLNTYTLNKLIQIEEKKYNK